MGKTITPQEKLFAYYISETNDRIFSIENSGYCKKVVDQGLKRGYYVDTEKHAIFQQAYRLMKKTEIKEEIEHLTNEKLFYLKESGVATQFEVLKWISDVMRGEYDNENAFLLQQKISAARELISYYSKQNKFIEKLKQDEPENIKNAKKFLVEYVPVLEDKGENVNEINTN